MQFMHANVGWTVVLLGSFCFSQIFLEGGYECRLKYYVNRVPHCTWWCAKRHNSPKVIFVLRFCVTDTALFKWTA